MIRRIYDEASICTIMLRPTQVSSCNDDYYGYPGSHPAPRQYVRAQWNLGLSTNLSVLGMAQYILHSYLPQLSTASPSINLSIISRVSSCSSWAEIRYNEFSEYRRDAWYIKTAVSPQSKLCPVPVMTNLEQVITVVTSNTAHLFLVGSFGEYHSAFRYLIVVFIRPTSLSLSCYELSVRAFNLYL